MKISISFLVIFLISCSIYPKKKYNLNGKVMMQNILYPMSAKVSVYQNWNKIGETHSNKEGYFDLNLTNLDLKKEVAFIVKHELFPDTIYNMNGHDKLLYTCKSDDTIFRSLTNCENKIELLITKCTLMIIQNTSPTFEH